MLRRIFTCLIALSGIACPVVCQAQEWADADAPDGSLSEIYSDDPEGLQAILSLFGADAAFNDMTLEELKAAADSSTPRLDNRAAVQTEQGGLVGEDRALISGALVWQPNNSSAIVTGNGRLAISVCFTTMDPVLISIRETTRAAVEATWEKYAALDFTGWGQCSGAEEGIRIGFANARPDSLIGVGAEYQLGASMMLASGFSWNFDCQFTQVRCHWSIAVHEFGHAIGLLHEQNQEDVPDWCRVKYPRVLYDPRVRATPLTKYDSESVMNYCTSIYTRKVLPSDCDIAAVQYVYGVPLGLQFRSGCQLVLTGRSE